MRWTLRIVAILAVLLAAYAAWPLYGLYQIAAAVEARNASALAERVDFASLRGSLSRQVVLAYLKLTGQGTGLGRLGTQVAASVGASIADSVVAKLVNPEALLDLLSRGAAPGAPGVPEAMAPVSSKTFANLWAVWLGTEYGGRTVHVSLPPDGEAAQRFRLELRLVRWRWQLTGVDLPEDLRVRLAEEVRKAVTR